MLEIQVLAWDRHKNVVGLNWLMESQPSSFYVLYILGFSTNVMYFILKDSIKLAK